MYSKGDDPSPGTPQTAWQRSARLTDSPSQRSLSSETSSQPSALDSQKSAKKKGALSAIRGFGRSLRKGRSTNDREAEAPSAQSASAKKPVLRDWQLPEAPSATASSFSAVLDAADGKSSMLAQIERGTFNLDAEMARLSEKGIVSLRADLAGLEAECSEELRRSVYDNYRPFIDASQGDLWRCTAPEAGFPRFLSGPIIGRALVLSAAGVTAAQGISELEGELQQLRGLMTGFAAMVAALKAVAATDPSRMAAEAADEASAREVVEDWRDTPDGQQWADALADIDVALAEKRCLDALNAIKSLPGRTELPDASIMGSDPDKELEARRHVLVPIMEAGVSEATASRAESRLAGGVLAAVSGRPHALRVLLAAHSTRLKRAQQQLLKPQNTGGGEADGTDFAGVMAQKVFGTVAAAADDVNAVFGEEATELTATLLVWALQETERAMLLLKRHALTPFAVPAGLGATVRCMLLLRAQALALQASHGIALAPRVTRELWPVVDAVLARRLRRVGDDVRKTLATEVDRLAREGVPKAGGKSGWGRLMASFQSADDMLDEVNFCVGCLAPLGGSRVAAALRKGLLELFTAYTSGMADAFTRYKGADGGFPALLDPAVDDAMETVSLLHEQFLPEAVAPLAAQAGEICGFEDMLPAVEALAEALGCALE